MVWTDNPDRGAATMRNNSLVQTRPGRGLIATLITLLLCGAAAASEDPPGRVARVNLLDGRGAMQSAGSESWVDDLVNRPLTGGDKLWIESDSRAELHIGSTALRLGARTALQVLAIDDAQVRLRVTAGSVSLRVRTLEEDDRFDIETPAGEIAILQPGGYRLDVDDQNERAQFAVWSGLAEASGRSGSRRVQSDESAELIGGDEPAVELAAAGPTDSLDLWAEDRDRREDQSRAARYVSREVVGYEELDGYGDWVVDPLYGSVWVPQVVVVDWAPYRFGYWDWIGPWGWTWIDDAPWGFAPCHYGRWVHARHGWAWAPGAHGAHRPVFAPALVAWRGDRYPRHEPGKEHAPRVGWVPLGFNEIYEPPFHASRNYLRATNLSNTRLAHGDVDRYLEEQQRGGARSGERRYVNAAVPGAMTVVTRDTFTSASPVGRNRLRADPEDLQQAPLSTHGLDIRPEARSLVRAAPADRPELRPDRAVFGRPVIRTDDGRAADAARMPGRIPESVVMPQRNPAPDAAPEIRPSDSRRVDRPAPRQREFEPEERAPVVREDRPAAPPSYPRIERGENRAPLLRLPETAAPRQPPGVGGRAPQSRYQPPSGYRAPQSAAREHSTPSAPPPASSHEDRQPRRERDNRRP
jgi:FecR protein